MKQHITISAEIVKGAFLEPTAKLTLVGVSHVGVAFGQYKDAKRITGFTGGAFIHDRVTFYSYDPSRSQNFSVFTDGYANNFTDFWLSIPSREGMKTTCNCPAKHWPRIRKAIEAFNAWGEKQ